jgi:hypothetical protein
MKTISEINKQNKQNPGVAGGRIEHARGASTLRASVDAAGTRKKKCLKKYSIQ